MLFAAVTGGRQDSSVQFVKTYDGGKPHDRPIAYEGKLNGDATEIEGRWKIRANWSGKFVMTRSRAPAQAVKREAEALV